MWVVQRLKNNCLYTQMAFDSFEKAMEYKEKLKWFKLWWKIVWNYLEKNNDWDWDEWLPF